MDYARIKKEWKSRAVAMRILRENGLTFTAIAKKYSLTPQRVEQIVKGKRK